MKEITLRVPEEVAPELEALVRKLTRVMAEEEEDVLLTIDEQDQCVAEAIRTLQRDKVIRSPRDFSWIMAVMNQQALDDFEVYFTPLSFIGYLKSINIDNRPGKSALYDNYSLVINDFPEWEFTDEPSHSEVVRRRNVGKRFLNAYRQAKHRVSEGFSEK